METELYFIGISPVDPIKSEIHQLKEYIYQKYGCKGSLRSTAHITLQMPFKMAQKKLKLLKTDLENFTATINPIAIELNNFGYFEPRVIYVNVIENEPLNAFHRNLEKLLKQHQIFNSTHRNHGFNPHITIAFRDLKKPVFYKVWEEFKNKKFTRDFSANQLTLFKHNGNSWDEDYHFKFLKS